jgi:molybdate transport system permease protein
MSWHPLLLSLEVATWATLYAGVFGVALAGLIVRTRFGGSDLLDGLITAPMVVPPTVLGYYLLLSVGRSSVIGRTYESLTGSPLVFTKSAAVLAATIAAFPFVVKSARAAMEDVDPRLLGAAATLGACRLRIFMTVVLPLSRNGVFAGLTLAFARALGDFGMTLMLAGNIPRSTQTGALAIYDAVLSNHEADAAAMVLVITLFAIAALYLVNKLTRRRAHAW